MTNSTRSDDPFERDIDRAVRGMTAGEPTESLRLRVMERVMRDRGARPRWPWAFAALATGAAAVLLVVVPSLEHGGGEVSPAVSSVAPVGDTALPLATAPAPAERPRVGSAEGPHRLPSADTLPRPSLARDAYVPSVDIVALTPVVPIAVEPLPMEGIAHPAIETPPLIVSPIDVEPLSRREERPL
jgi:hypothetical protein